MIPSQGNMAAPQIRLIACELLGVDHELEQAELRRRALEQVEAWDYAPSPAWRDALERLGTERSTLAADLRPALRDELECRLAEDIAQFAEVFFTVEPEAREVRWRALIDRAGCSPPLCIWLSRLEPGLKLNLNPARAKTDPLVEELARRSASLFVQRPDIRARMATDLIESISDRPRAAKRAAAELRASRPGLAALVPSLLDELVSLPSRQRRVARCDAARRRRQTRWYRAWRSVADRLRASPWTVAAVIAFVLVRGLALMDTGKKAPPRLPQIDQQFRERMRSQQGRDALSRDLERLIRQQREQAARRSESGESEWPARSLPSDEVEGTP